MNSVTPSRCAVDRRAEAEVFCEGEWTDDSSIALCLPSVAIDGPAEDLRFAAKSPTPVIQVRIQFVCVQLMLLPLGIVRELDGKLRKRRRISLSKGLIERREFRRKYLIDGYAIDNALVGNQKKSMCGVAGLN